MQLNQTNSISRKCGFWHPLTLYYHAIWSPKRRNFCFLFFVVFVWRFLSSKATLIMFLHKKQHLRTKIWVLQLTNVQHVFLQKKLKRLKKQCLTYDRTFIHADINTYTGGREQHVKVQTAHLEKQLLYMDSCVNWIQHLAQDLFCFDCCGWKLNHQSSNQATKTN